MSGDRSYQTIKLDLADVIRGLMHLGRLRHHDENASRAQSLLVRLAEDRFQLAVVGRFNAGKSSLMNAIMGQPLLPTGVRPLTSVITSVCYGSRPGIDVSFKNGGLPVHGTVDQLREYATEEGNPANSREVSSVILRAPVEQLRNGLYFIDTPGIGSDIVANTATTERFLPDADAVVFVTGFDVPMQPEEVDFLCRVRRHARKIFVVANKLDLVGRGRREEILGKIRAAVDAQFMPSSTLRVFAVSAQDGLQAKLGGSAEGLIASGLPDLEDALWAFLAEGKIREFLSGTSDRAKQVLNEEWFYVKLGDEGQCIRTNIERRIQEITLSAEAPQTKAGAQIRTALPRALEPTIAQWKEEVLRTLPGQAGNSGEEYREAVIQALRKGWDLWVARQTSSLAGLLLNLASSEIQEILGLANRVRSAALNLLGPTDGLDELDVRSIVLERNRMVFTAAPEQSHEISAPWWTFGRRARKAEVRLAVEAYSNQCRTRTVEAALDWLDRLFRESIALFQSETRNIVSALESPDVREDWRALERLTQDLQQVNSAIESMQIPEDPRRQEGLPVDLRVGRCLICAQLAKALYDFLSHEQYLLATDPDRQREHARERGFCTLHAWQYESIASPQGLCLAYARLLDERAGELLGAIEKVDTGAVYQAVDTGLPGAHGCRVCQHLSEIEQAAAQKIAIGLDPRRNGHLPSLCLLHLKSVLNAGVPGPVARKLATSEAHALKRCAQDMRMYALKHDAVRRELVTEEERSAFQRGLAAVAGEPTMARPRRTHD